MEESRIESDPSRSSTGGMRPLWGTLFLVALTVCSCVTSPNLYKIPDGKSYSMGVAFHLGVFSYYSNASLPAPSISFDFRSYVTEHFDAGMEASLPFPLGSRWVVTVKPYLTGATSFNGESRIQGSLEAPLLLHQLPEAPWIGIVPYFGAGASYAHRYSSREWVILGMNYDPFYQYFYSTPEARESDAPPIGFNLGQSTYHSWGLVAYQGLWNLNNKPRVDAEVVLWR